MFLIIYFSLDRPIGKTEDIIEQQTSRYRNEFKELGILGKGGFGSVFKVSIFLMVVSFGTSNSSHWHVH